jgi:hypothetical protein
MPKPNSFGTMGTVNTELSSDFTPPDIKKKKDADLPQIAGMCPGRPISKPVETDVIPVINKAMSRIPSFTAADKPATPDNLTMKTINPRKPGGNFSTGDKVACKGSDSPGFKSVQSKIAEQYGGDMKKAGAILASRSRSASPAAKAKNPNLSKVKGEAKQKGFDDLEEKSIVSKRMSHEQMATAIRGGPTLLNKARNLIGENPIASVTGTAALGAGGGIATERMRKRRKEAGEKPLLGSYGKSFDDIETKSLKDKVVTGTSMIGAGYVGSEIANRTQDARRLAENKQLTKEFEMADRGNASYVEMKEFMNADFVEKGGTSPETLPNEKGGDEAEKDKLTDVMNKKQPPKGGLKTDAPDLTMDPEVQMVADKAEDDITSGYVGDTQGAKVGGKGFDAFNEMVSKGIVADVNINRYNVHDSVTKVNEVADVTMKSIGSGLEEVGKRVEEGLRSGTTLGNVGRFDKRLRRGAADVVGGHKKLVGGALVGGAGLGAAAGGKKIYDKVVED